MPYRFGLFSSTAFILVEKVLRILSVLVDQTFVSTFGGPGRDWDLFALGP